MKQQMLCSQIQACRCGTGAWCLQRSDAPCCSQSFIDHPPRPAPSNTHWVVSWTWLFDLSVETSETSCVIIDTVSFWLRLLRLVQRFDRNKLQVMQINDTQFLLNAFPQTQHNRSYITIWSMGLLQNHWSVTVTPGPVLFPVNNAAEFLFLHWCNALEQPSDTHQSVYSNESCNDTGSLGVLGILRVIS